MTLGLTGRARRAAWVGLAVLVLAPIAALVGEIWILRPFAAQTARGLGAAYAVRRFGPAAGLAALAGVALLAGALWSGSRRWRGRVALVAALAVAAVTARLARDNPLEKMFKPAHASAFASAGEAARWVGEDDMVLAVGGIGSDLKGGSVAFPVRQVAYHHVVQAVVGGRPIVATY